MALATNELYSESSRGPLPRIQPAEGPGAVTNRAFAAVAGAPTLPVGTPIYIAAATGLANKIVPGALAATNDIWGIVWPEAIKLADTGGGEVLGRVMEKGSIHYKDIEALSVSATPAGTVLAGTLQQLKDCCRKPSNRTRGIVIEGLDLIGGDAGI